MNNLLFKRLTFHVSLILFLLMQVIGYKGYGQAAMLPSNQDSSHSFCEVVGGGNGAVIPPGYTTVPGSIENCGVFDFYFEDVMLGNGWGFNDPASGADRRATVCLVATYLQNVFDFGQVPVIDHIRIEIRSSQVTPVGWQNTDLSGAFIFTPNIANTNNGYYGGYVFDKINDYINYQSYNYNGFDGAILLNLAGWGISTSAQINLHNDGGTPVGNCETDLYSLLLHDFTHLLGFFSMVIENPAGMPIHDNAFTPNANAFSKYDEIYLFRITNITTAPIVDQLVINPTNNAPIINPALVNVPLFTGDMYLQNTGRHQDNQPVFDGFYYGGAINTPGVAFNHLHEAIDAPTCRYWITPGHKPNYVMSPFFYQGIERRVITNPELRVLLGIGYTLNLAFANTIPPGMTENWNDILQTNRKPECNDDYSSVIDIITLGDLYAWVEGISTMSNVGVDAVISNPGPPLVININSSPSATNPALNKVTDADGDIIRVIPESIVGLRGVGIGGNNHNCLTLSNNNTTITYTPRPDFIGRAQFYFQTTDERENGAIVLYTIDVQPGPGFVNTPVNELVINGSFEEGTEVRTLTNPNIIGNTSHSIFNTGYFQCGAILSDAHPLAHTTNFNLYEYGILVRDCFKDCGTGTIPFSFGRDYNSFPNGVNPNSTNTPQPNNRYLDALSIPYFAGSLAVNNVMIPHVNFSQLASTLIPGHLYQLRYDLYCANTPANFSMVVNSFNNGIQYFNVTPTQTDVYALNPTTLNWQTVTHNFAYCGATGSNLLEIYPLVLNNGPSIYLDNISLIDLGPSVYSVSALPANNTICTGQSATLTATGGANYTWQPGNLTGSNVTVSPTTTTTYTVTATSGLNNACSSIMTITINVNPSPVVSVISSGVCAPVTLTASGANTYLWQPGNLNGAIVTVSPIINTTYTVTGTSANGCTTTSSAIVNVPFTASISSDPLNMNNNPCDAKTLYAFPNTAGYSYNWNVPLGVIPSSTSIQPAQIYGTYTVTITDANGCTSSATYTTFPPAVITSITANPSQSLCVGSQVVLEALPLTYTYLWNPGALVTNPISVTPLATTIYTATATDGNGCTTTAIIEIEVVTPDFCCQPNGSAISQLPFMKFANNISASQFATNYSLLGTTWSNQKIYINGIFHVNIQNLTWNNCEIYLTPNSEIIVDNGINFTINNSIIQAPCDMWKGITASVANSITINNSTLKDMTQGVLIENNVNASIIHNTFLNNRIAMQFRNTPFNPQIAVKENDISAPSLKAPYLNQVGEHGIYLFQTLMITIGENSIGTYNRFHDLKNGIIHLFNYANSNPVSTAFGFTSLHNQFFDIVGGTQISNQFNPNTTTNLYQDYVGCGIYMNYKLQGIKTVAPTSNLNSVLDEFTNNTKAIVTNAVYTDIAYANVQNSQCGFMNAETEWCHYNIHENDLQDVFYGIQFVGNSGQNSLVQNNTIKLVPNYLFYMQAIGYYNPNNNNVNYIYEPSALWPIGIDVQHINNSYSSPFDIGGNAINPNQPGYSNYIEIPGNGGIGINMNNVGSGFKVSENKVKFTTQDATVCGGPPYQTLQGECRGLTGIVVKNAYNTMFERNHLSSDHIWGSTLFNNRYSTGFDIQDSKELLLECNTTLQTHYGVNSRGICNTAKENVRGNLFNNHKLAWLFRSFNLNPGGFGENIGNSNNVNYEDNTNLFNGSYYNYYGSPTKVLRLTYPSDNNTFRFIYTNPNNPWASPNAYNINQQESKSNVAGGQYDIQNDNTYNFFTDCFAPINIMPDGTTEGGLTSDEALDIVNGENEYPLFNEVSQFLDRAYLYRLLEANQTLINEEQSLATFYGTQSDENIGRIRSVDKLIAMLADSTIQTDSITYSQLLQSISDSNNTIVDSNRTYENCERWINARYATVLNYGVDSIVASDKINIALLANSCPVAVGNCVYKARSLYALIAPGMQYYDDVLCAAALPANKNGKNPYEEENNLLNENGFVSPLLINNDSFLLYPNPNFQGGTLTIKYTLSSKEIASVVISDIVGKVIQKTDLNPKNNFVQFNLSQGISNGIYKVDIFQNNRIIKTFKLNVTQ